MKTWTLMAIGTAVAVAGVTTVALVAPLHDAEATPRAEVVALLDDMAPGADVGVEPDGSVSVSGALNASARADVARAQQLANANPWIIRCSAAGAISKCTPVPDDDVAAVVAGGATGLYHRVIYRTSTDPADVGAPLFDAGELVCVGRAMLTCRGVTAAPPTVSRSERLVLTYRPAQLSLNGDGSLVLHLNPVPAVPLQRTP